MGAKYTPSGAMASWTKDKKPKKKKKNIIDDLEKVKPSTGDDSDTAKGKEARKGMAGGPNWTKKKKSK